MGMCKFSMYDMIEIPIITMYFINLQSAKTISYCTKCRVAAVSSVASSGN